MPPRAKATPIPQTVPELQALVQQLLAEQNLRRHRKARIMRNWRDKCRAVLRMKAPP